MKILHEWHFHNRVCRVVESDPGIVHFEEATRTTGDPSIMLFNYTPTPMGAANEIIQLSMALAEANVINRDLSAAIQRWQEDRTARDQEIERLRAELAKVTEQRDAWPKYHGTAVEGLMILHDRKDLQDLAGLRCGDFMANAVPHIVAEIDRLRAREKLWSEYVALMVESEKLTITMFHVHGGRFPVEMIERGKRLRYALGLE